MKRYLLIAWSVLWMPVAVFVAQKLRVQLLPGQYQWDMMAHFLGGFSIAYGTLNLLRALPKKLIGWPLTRFTLFVALVFSTMFVGVCWEWYEWLAFHGTTGRYDGINFSEWAWWTDTLNDLLMDTLGATSYAIIIAMRKQK